MVTLCQSSMWGGDHFKSSILLYFNTYSTSIRVTGLSHKQLGRDRDEIYATAVAASENLDA